MTHAPGWLRGPFATAMVVLGALVLQLGLLAGYVNHEILDTDRFAGDVDRLRQEPTVSAALGRELTDAFLTSEPDAVAVRPLIDAVATSIVGSEALSGPTRTAVADLVASLTQPNSKAVVLRIADAGAVLTSVLERIAPPGTVTTQQTRIPLELARIGDQSFASSTIKLARFVRVSSWLLPLIGVSLMSLGVIMSGRRRRAMLVGGSTMLVLSGVLALLLALGGWWASGRDASTTSGALISAGWPILLGPLWWIVLGMGVIGLLLTASAASLLPELDPAALARRMWARASRRPQQQAWQVVRAVALVLLGVAFIVRPNVLLAAAALLVAVFLILDGVHELAVATTDADARARRRSPAQSTDRRPARGTAAVAGALAVVVVGSLVVWGAFSSSTSSASTASSGAVVTGKAATCNGYAQQCDRPFNKVAFAASHNSMSTASDPHWFLPEQNPPIVGQLDNGVRALLIDVWPGYPTTDGRVATDQSAYAEAKAQLVEELGAPAVEAALRVVNQVTDNAPAGPTAMYMCHGLCELGWTPFQESMTKVKAWLDAHPDEVLTIDIEDHAPIDQIGQALVASGLSAYAATPPAQGQAWPTLREMITSGKRLYVVLEKGDGGTAYPWMANAYARLIQETPFTNSSVADLATCKPNRGRPDAPLFLMNHWLSGFGSLVTSAEKANAQDVLGPRAQLCLKERQLPNFVAVNYAGIGSLQDVVKQLNGL